VGPYLPGLRRVIYWGVYLSLRMVLRAAMNFRLSNHGAFWVPTHRDRDSTHQQQSVPGEVLEQEEPVFAGRELRRSRAFGLVRRQQEQPDELLLNTTSTPGHGGLADRIASVAVDESKAGVYNNRESEAACDYLVEGGEVIRAHPVIGIKKEHEVAQSTFQAVIDPR
jgi:hypothetical protein